MAVSIGEIHVKVNTEEAERTLAHFTQSATAAADAARELSHALTRLELATARAEQFYGTQSETATPQQATTEPDEHAAPTVHRRPADTA